MPSTNPRGYETCRARCGGPHMSTGPSTTTAALTGATLLAIDGAR